jgi:hypothetical protein
MVRGWVFRLMILGMGLLAIIVWAGDAYQNWDNDKKWAPSVATLVEAHLTGIGANGKAVNGVAQYRVELGFNTETGQQVTVTSAMDKSSLNTLMKQQKQDLWYLRSDPQTIRFYSGHREPEVGFLVVGLILVGVFAISLRLR